MPKVDADTIRRHKEILARYAQPGSRIYSLIRRSRSGVINGARFLVVQPTEPDEMAGRLVDITMYLASISGSVWENDRGGYLRTRDPSGVVGNVAETMWGSSLAYKYDRI